MKMKKMGMVVPTVVLIAASSVIGWTNTISGDPGITAQTHVARERISQMQPLKAELSKSQKKLSTDLLQLTDSKFLPEGTSRAVHAASMEHWGQFSPEGALPALEGKMSEERVYVYVYLRSNVPTNRIDSYALEVTDRDEKNHLAVAWVAVEHLETLASLKAVRAVRSVVTPVVYAGSVTTEGDAIHRAEEVRSTYGQSGSGIKVGIISNGVNSRATAQFSGDLPADGEGLTVLSDVVSGEEGTAMLEIVHDMAPDAGLYFHDCGTNTAAFNSAISALVTAGCNVICDDIGWITQPFFEDGAVASHVTSVLADNDIIYVSSAGNAGQRHYQGDYYPIPSYTQHDFSRGGTSGYYLKLQMAAGSNVIIVLQWNDEFSHSGNDYDLGLYSYGAAQYVAASAATQDGDDDPLEAFSYTVPTGTATCDYVIVVDKWSGDPKTLELFIYPTSGVGIYSYNITPVDAVFGHAAVPNALAVGAIRADDPGNDDIEYFSSQGPSTISYPASESRSKPDICGIDGVSVTGAGSFPSIFYGTSAAAPHVAALAAQSWGAFPYKTGDEVRDALKSSAVDLGAAGFDYVFGSGRADTIDVYQTLPVELSSFTARTGNGAVTLHWITESETDNLGFHVYRALAEGGEYERLTPELIEGAGNSATKQDYSFSDIRLTNGVTYWYKLEDVAFDGTTQIHGPTSVTPYGEAVAEIQAVPEAFGLTQNYPNPFNPCTEIQYQLPEASRVELVIYDLLGQDVRVLVSERQPAGWHRVSWDGRNKAGQTVSSGVYLYRLETEDFVQTRRMLLLR